MPSSSDPHSDLTRRKFLALSSVVPAALAVQSVASRALAAAEPAAPAKPADAKKYPIGLELYSVRAALARDLPGTLREVAKIGHTISSSSMRPITTGPSLTRRDVRTLMDDLASMRWASLTAQPL